MQVLAPEASRLGVFAVTGLAVAYFSFRKDTKSVISPIFYPLLGEHVNGPIGKAIDILAIFVTLVGIAVSSSSIIRSPSSHRS